MDEIRASIIGVFWDTDGRMILGLSFSQEGGSFSLQLAPDLFAEFEFVRIGCGNFADAFDIIGRATGFAALTGVSPAERHPVLCPVNAPVQRAAAEAEFSQLLLSGIRLEPGVLGTDEVQND